MSGLALLWQKNRVHLKTRITDIIFIKDSEIISWLYTSKTGSVMKHKSSSTSIPKLISTFTPSPQSDKIVGLYRNLKENTSKLLLFSHFELIIFQISQKALPEDCILQRITPLSIPTLFVSSFKLPNFELNSAPLSSKYLINGKYFNKELEEAPIVPPNGSLLSISNEIVEHLGKTNKSILSCTLEFLQDEHGYYLLDILNVTEGVILAGRAIIKSVSESIPIPRSRPITARSANRSFIFTHQEVETSFSITTNRTTTPKCFKLSYNFQNKLCQTVPTPCCEKNSALTVLKQKILQAKVKKSSLQYHLNLLIQENTEQLQELETNWKAKCIKLSQTLAERKITEQRRGRSVKRLLL